MKTVTCNLQSIYEKEAPLKIRFLGTAAAEGVPALFCSCERCKRAWSLGGKNIRTRCQTLINDDLLIDLGPDTLLHSIRYGIDLTTIQNCLVTHDHSDHFYKQNLAYIRKGYSWPPKDWTFRVYSNPEIAGQVNAVAQGSGGQLEGVALEPFVPASVGRYTVTPLKARHGTENPYTYAISDGSRTLLYGHDTDIFRDETWDYLRSSGLRFDLVTLDCTEGAHADLNYHGHMCLGRNCRFREILQEAGLVSDSTLFIANHFSHNGLHACYDDFAPLAEKEGFLTSYDGMELSL